MHDFSTTESLHTICATKKVHFADGKFNKQFVSRHVVGTQNGFDDGYRYLIEFKCTLGIV